MQKPAESVAAKTGYAFLFVVVVPLFLGFWAFFTAPEIRVPVPAFAGLGYAIGILGIGLMLMGTAALWNHGHGLPMNAFPPPDFVTVSVYRYLSHPIYVGFCLTVAGVSIIERSASGFWLVTPVTVLSCLALVYGFESHDLASRFGLDRAKPLIRLPAADSSKPTRWDRLSIYVMVFIPWMVAYELAVMVGPNSQAWSAALPWEYNPPIVEWTELFYASAYLWVALAPVFAGKRKILREFAVSGLLATALGMFLFFLFPMVIPERFFEPRTIFGQLLKWEQSYDTPAASFPAFHFIWALLTARLFTQSLPKYRWVWIAWTAAIAVSCITVGAHVLADLAASSVAVLLVWNRKKLGTGLLQATERLCNSWKEWRFGSIRIISHGGYAGLGALFGVFIVIALLPDSGSIALLTVNLGGLLGGALLAQGLEGSSKLLRPFGYFGSILGAVLALIVLSRAGFADGWMLCAAFATAAPVIQAFGRLRCLVQGCCHGYKADLPSRGIRYRHPSSRVTRLADMAGIPLYPTPLYSILWNLLVFLVLGRLWFLGCSASIIAGLYFILIGLGRFVEESYRGEPQTLIVRKLRIYQWFSIGFLVAGAILTCLPSPPVPGLLGWNWNQLPVAAVCGAAAWVAMGVDFPASNRRFARLSG